MTMYSPGIASPTERSSIDGAMVVVGATDVVVVVVLVDEVLVDEVLVDEVLVDVVLVDDVDGTTVVVVDATVVVVGSIVSITDITEFGSTIITCGSRFRRRTSAVSSSATNPFTLLENTSLTSLPSDASLLTFAATLAESRRMTM